MTAVDTVGLIKMLAKVYLLNLVETKVYSFKKQFTWTCFTDFCMENEIHGVYLRYMSCSVAIAIVKRALDR